MLYLITVPSRDYDAIKYYLKRGYPNQYAMELIGRVYTIEEDGYMITAKIMRDRAAILYTVQNENKTIKKIVASQICAFHDMDVIVTFDIDRTYEG